MFRPVKQKRPGVSILYFFVVVAIVAFAAPKLRENTAGWHGVFQIAWLLFALLVMASNLWFALGVTREQKTLKRGRQNPELRLAVTGARISAKREGK